MLDLLTIGNATLDIIIVIDDAKVDCTDKKKCMLCVPFGAKIPIETSIQSVGGNAANVAIGTKQLGVLSAIYTFIGTDFYGETIIKDLESYQIPCNLVISQKNIVTKHAVILNHQVERTIFSYQSPYKNIVKPFPKTKWIYYTSLGKGFGTLQTAILKHIKKNPNIKLAMNPGSYQLKHAIGTIRKAIPHTDVLIANKEEASTILGKNISLKKTLTRLYEKGAKTVIITDGTKGSYSYDGTEILHMPIYPIPATARTGAGDAFSGGLLSALIQKKPLHIALTWGTAQASGVVETFGAHNGLLSKKALLARIKKYPNIYPTPLE